MLAKRIVNTFCGDSLAFILELLFLHARKDPLSSGARGGSTPSFSACHSPQARSVVEVRNRLGVENETNVLYPRNELEVRVGI